MKIVSLIPFLLFATLFVIQACTSDHKDQSPIIKQNFFDSLSQTKLKLLDSMHLSRFDDSAKWRLYTYYCDEIITNAKWKNQLVYSNILVGSLPLKLTFLNYENDTISMVYNFIYKDSVRLSDLQFDNSIFDGVVYKVSTGKLVYFISGEGFAFQHGSKTRFENPLQPEVVKFIKENQKKINHWFRNEAKRKGIIK
jgi:hypothetical protein